jgi:hypothetical protein
MNQASHTLQGLCQNFELPWGLVGVISCDFVDRFFGNVTGDPRNHTKQHEQETGVIRGLTQSLQRCGTALMTRVAPVYRSTHTKSSNPFFT